MIKKNSVVSLSYCLKNDRGVELDNSDGGEPLAYLHGSGQIVPGLEKALEGLAVGAKKDVTVTPEEGYGNVSAELKLKVARTNFPEDAEIKEGMQFMGQVGDGKQLPFTVKGIEGEEIMIDGNHPLAGETLHFSIEVVSIREATQEELTHGHAHGEGGHSH